MVPEVAKHFCCPPITLPLRKWLHQFSPLLVHSTTQKRPSSSIPSQAVEFIYYLHIVWFINRLNNYFSTAYDETDTVLILGETKMRGELMPSMSVAEMENWQHSKCDKCCTASKYREMKQG